jgi:hypothetical protein
MLSELFDLTASAEEDPMLVDVERTQPRKGGTIIRPAQSPGGINPAQRLD